MHIISSSSTTIAALNWMEVVLLVWIYIIRVTVIVIIIFIG